jgi:hypothetical protein
MTRSSSPASQVLQHPGDRQQTTAPGIHDDELLTDDAQNVRRHVCERDRR